MTPLDHEPASKYQYSNAGINTAARIIESLDVAVDQRVLQDDQQRIGGQPPPEEPGDMPDQPPGRGLAQRWFR